MLNLTSEQKLLFELLKYSLGKESTLPFDETIDWQLVIKEASEQAVVLLACDAVSKSDLGADIKALWSRVQLPYMGMNFKSIYAVSETNRIMSSNDFSYVILKGVSAASYYPNYFNRILGDVDFLIDSNQRVEVEKTLETEGYENWNKDHICHTVFRKPNQDLEMHFEISGIPDGEPGKIVREYMKNALENTIHYKMGSNGTVKLPLPKYHGLILFLHMQHHMLAEGIGLRHLMDVCCFVDKTWKDSFWEDELLPLLKRIGLYRYAQAMVKTGGLYFGTVIPEWCENIEESLCDEIMLDILTGGNFGRKNPERSASGMMISEHGKNGTKKSKFGNLWSTIVKTIPLQFPIVKKRPILYPFLIVWFIIRRFWRVVTGQRKSLVSSIKYVDERKSVYDKLKVFEVE